MFLAVLWSLVFTCSLRWALTWRYWYRMQRHGDTQTLSKICLSPHTCHSNPLGPACYSGSYCCKQFSAGSNQLWGLETWCALSQVHTMPLLLPAQGSSKGTAWGTWRSTLRAFVYALTSFCLMHARSILESQLISLPHGNLKFLSFRLVWYHTLLCVTVKILKCCVWLVYL